jgi:hypothetical protein
MHKQVFLVSIFLFIFSLASCDDSDSTNNNNSNNNENNINNINNQEKTPFGSPCDAATDCDELCNIGLPDGMCVRICSDQQPCSIGTCIHFAENTDYCLPSCTTNDECRDKYACVNDICRPLAEFSQLCDETTDCLPCQGQDECPQGKTIECIENICSYKCNNGDECPNYTVCAMSSDENWCVLIDFEVGVGTYGDSCGEGTCAEGFTCIPSGQNDVLAYCSKECAVDRDCPPDLICSDIGMGTNWCVERKTCDACSMDSQCAYQNDKCVYSDPNASTQMSYCSVSCDPDFSETCSDNFSCNESFFCADKNAWVADCGWCPTGTCQATSPTTYQCYNSAGTCI